MEYSNPLKNVKNKETQLEVLAGGRSKSFRLHAPDRADERS
jgi:hypothetical protein